MMYGLKPLQEKLKKNELRIGTHVAFESPFFTEALGGIGFDFVWIDGEHGAIDSLDIEHHVMACRAAGAASFVRVPWAEIYLVKKVIDMGADAIVFPMICSKEDAEKAVSFCRYPPAGIRGFGIRRACNYQLDDKTDYIKNSDSRVWKIMQIEHINGFKNLEEIAGLEGVDSICFGPNDFACSLGYVGTPYGQEETLDYFRTGVEKVKRSGKPVGVSIGYDNSAVKFWMGLGVDWIGIGQDFNFMTAMAVNAFNDAKRIAKESNLTFNQRP
jgi:2-keto-3-deoxy-L-rhamnonate aldolase RhmA